MTIQVHIHSTAKAISKKKLGELNFNLMTIKLLRC